VLFAGLCVSFGCVLVFVCVIIFSVVAEWHHYKLRNHLCLSRNVSAKACLYNMGVGHPFSGAFQHASLCSGVICFVIPITGTLAYSSCQHQKVFMHKDLCNHSSWVETFVLLRGSSGLLLVSKKKRPSGIWHTG
jgi:hypothetical protein